MNLIEPMSSGLPIVCFNRDPMPWGLDDLGGAFDPELPVGIARVRRELTVSLQLRTGKVQVSVERSWRLTWQRCADDIFTFLAEIALSADRRAP